VELLAPAGNWESFIAAIENGADAVYLGGREFSARQYAANFEIEDIRKAVEYAHVRGKKVYITVNTLIDQTEFDAVLDFVFQLQESGVDALIIQDIGLMSVLRRVFPDLRLHASTQMTIHNVLGVRFLKENGFSRVVLARELTRQEIEAIREAVPDIEIEIFVHGALCYSYSGQCLFSSVVGGRSGNRGRCAQPCRLPYRLRSKEKGDYAQAGEYPLSPADLCLIQCLPDIKAAGVDSLKIEGRMKRAEYVATVTRVYRQALDRLEAGEDTVPQEMLEELAGIFNRTFTPGLWAGRGTGVLSPSRPNNRGIYIGRVLSQKADGFTSIRLTRSLRVGDGIEVWVRSGKNPATVVTHLEVQGQAVQEAGPGSVPVIPLSCRVAPGDRVFRTHDTVLVGRAAATMVENRPEGKVKIGAVVEVSPGEPLKITFRDKRGIKAQACTRSTAVPAETRPLSEQDIYEKVSRLGNTPFEIEDFKLFVEEPLIVPFSEINQARREAADQLRENILKLAKPPAIDRKEFTRRLNERAAKSSEWRFEKPARKTMLSVFAGRVDVARAALESGADRVYLDLEGLKGLKTSERVKVLELKQLAINKGHELVLALPRITGPLQEIPWDEIEEVGFEGVLAANPGLLLEARERGLTVFADYPLNTFNPEAARFWLEHGAENFCLSPELSSSQLKNWPQPELSWAEVLTHGDLILMISAYCPWKALGQGKEGKCERPCREDEFFLVDRKGYEFPVRADNHCRVYLFNSRTLCLIEELPELLELGIGTLRIEARLSSAQAVAETVLVYRQAIDGLIQGKPVRLASLKERLKKLALSDFSKIHYYRGVV